jgi:hypothetical protein
MKKFQKEQLRRFDSTDTMDSNGTDDGTLIVRKVRRKSQGTKETGFVPKSANQTSPLPKEGSDAVFVPRNINQSPVSKESSNRSSPTKLSNAGTLEIKEDKNQSPLNSTQKGGSSVASNQSSVQSQVAKDVEDPMEPIQLPKPSTLTVPDLPPSQPRQMIFSLHSKPPSESYVTESNSMGSFSNYSSPHQEGHKVVLPVRVASNVTSPEPLYVDDGYGNPSPYNAGYHNNVYNNGARQQQQHPPPPLPLSKEGSRRSSYSNTYMYGEGNGSEYNRVDVFSYDAQLEPVSPRSYNHGVTPTQQHSPYHPQENYNYNNNTHIANNSSSSNSYQNTPNTSHSINFSGNQVEYAQNPMLGHKVQRVGVNVPNVPSSGNSQLSGYSGVTSQSANSHATPMNSPPQGNNGGRAGPMRESPQRPQSPDSKKNDRLRTLVMTNMSETEQIRVALLISTQDDKYGTNMFDSLNADNHAEIESMLQRGYKHEQALLTIFKRKFEPLISPAQNPVASGKGSRRSSANSVGSGSHVGYDSENFSNFPQSSPGHPTRHGSYVDSRDYPQGNPQYTGGQRGREYIGYHPEDEPHGHYYSNNPNNNNDDFDDGRSYTSHQMDNYSVRSGVSRNDQRSGASNGGGGHQRSGSNAQAFVGYIDNFDPVSAMDNISISSGALPPAPLPPRRLHAAHSTSSISTSSRSSYPYSGDSQGGPAMSSGMASNAQLPRTRSSYDRSEFATYDQYNAHPSSAANNYNNNNVGSQVPYYVQDHQQYSNAPYEDYDGYQGYQANSTHTSPRQAVGRISSGNSVVSSTGSGDKRIGAVYSNSANYAYAAPPHGSNYNTYNR